MNTRPGIGRILLVPIISVMTLSLVSVITASLVSVITISLAPFSATAQIPDQEYAERRSALMEIYPDGLILIKARSSAKGMGSWGWVQSASFLYFTGLTNQPAAILALDGSNGESILFVPPDPLSFGQPVRGLSLRPGKDSAHENGFSDVRSWDDFKTYITGHVTAGVETIYIEQSRRQENASVPAFMAAVSGDFALWEQSLRQAFPALTIGTASDGIRALRWKKSDAEIEILRTNARRTASALEKGAALIRPGAKQRDAEAAVVAGCISAGAEGPSFWPWMMSGPNTNFSELIRSFFDYNSLNREMKGGELVRADVGCASNSYGGDVGRTFPVSGKFTVEQRIVWNLLVTGYMAGVQAMGDGVSGADVRSSSRDAIRKASEREAAEPGAREAAEPGAQKTTLEIAEAMTADTGGVNWHLHGVGVESGEEQQPVLVRGAVIAYEPGFTWNGESYYLEDMILIHQDHAEILSIGLPYTSDEIESFMAGPGRAAGESYALFNGHDLSGWVNYGTEKWYVEDGELVCESGPDAAYGYLGTDEVFGDFELTLEFLQESNGNSGVFFRSWIHGTAVEGWQVEIAPPMAHTGGIYESYGRGWLIQPDEDGEKALREGQWNTMRILAIGGHVTTWLNGKQMVDITDEKIGAARGRIALQIHDGGGIKVRWRNIYIRRL